MSRSEKPVVSVGENLSAVDTEEQEKRVHVNGKNMITLLKLPISTIEALKKLQKKDRRVEIGKVIVGSSGNHGLQLNKELLPSVEHDYSLVKADHDESKRFFLREDKDALQREKDMMELYVRLRAGEDGRKQEYLSKASSTLALKVEGEVAHSLVAVQKSRPNLNKSTKKLTVLSDGPAAAMPQQRADRPKVDSKKAKRQKVDELPKSKLEDLLFEKFETQQSWTLRELQKDINQPPKFLRQCLQEIAIFHQQGEFRGSYTLKEQYKQKSD
eukprot:CAMPEP_0113883472 /NCGR_PEP_ID=MMETSP0780_2-20120614/9625_1 /TAXON_ID=652834 /ORGANISM="Palpitomonas bilix" /LENGTH=270 /DNA_ID=CAMNT_0000870793 /DNA_START=154 /DNA_END=966 /DNA_ORIENTATION=- /assembly_acc=CAM_ASM_000599